MKRFVFHLQAVLDLRSRRERDAQRSLAQLNRSQVELQARLRQAEMARRAVMTTWRQELVGTLDISDLRSQAAQARSQDHRARQLVLELAALEPQVASARETLGKATAERRAMEYLRDRARTRWLRSIRRQSRRDEAEQTASGRVSI
ncbi:MAG: flagellar export protein FliJ [Phycisphaerales bacterium]|nr:flagellar export protein FliJ [Phycisphaerales bacterium]